MVRYGFASSFNEGNWSPSRGPAASGPLMEVVSRKRSGDVTILFFGDLGSFRFAQRLLLSAHFFLLGG